jgi:MFS family permease
MSSTTRSVLASTGRLQRENLHWRRPLIAGIVTGLLAALCIATDHTSYAVPLAVGAWFTSLIDTQQPFGIHVRAMWWSALWLALGATIGGFSSSIGYWQLVTVAVMSIGCGWAASLGGLSLVNGSLALVMYAVFAGSPVTDRAALLTGVLVFIGGLVTIVTSLAIYAVGARDQMRERPPTSERVSTRIRGHLHRNDAFVRYGVRLAIIMVVATTIAHSLSWPHEYWIPMTVAWVARPGSQLTLERTWHRVLGTIVGIVFVTALMLTAGNSPYHLAVLAAAGATITLIFVRAHYAIAVVGITITMMSLFAIEGQSFDMNAPFRIWATLVAGVLLTVGALFWPADN